MYKHISTLDTLQYVGRWNELSQEVWDHFTPSATQSFSMSSPFLDMLQTSGFFIFSTENTGPNNKPSSNKSRVRQRGMYGQTKDQQEYVEFLILTYDIDLQAHLNMYDA